jgi:hypothetical protein
MRNGLGYMAAGSAVVRVVVIGRGRLVLLGLRGMAMRMVGAVGVMMMTGSFYGVMGNMVLIARPVGMAPRSKQTVGQMQKDCNDGDDFEGLAQHGSDFRQSAAGSQLQLSCIITPPPPLLFSGSAIFYDDPVFSPSPDALGSPSYIP